jgi:hypothetical protein
VVIKRSSSREVSALLDELEAGPDDAREAAVARLAVIGTRAVEALIGRLGVATPVQARAGALAALEAIAAPRAMEPALACLDDPDQDVRAHAAALLRRLLDSTRGAETLDRLTAVAVDRDRPDHARVAALDALRDVSAPALELLSASLQHDPSLAVRATVIGPAGAVVLPPAEALEEAASGRLPDNPDTMRQWLAAAGPQVPLPTLHRLVQLIREREKTTSEPVARGAWTTARGMTHQVLAGRGSTVALYDLRESVESGEGLAVEMIPALQAIGDRSCLEPIAAAFSKAASAADAGASQAAWWRQHLAETFRAVAAREKLSERQSVVKRIRARWPDAAIALLGPPR